MNKRENISDIIFKISYFIFQLLVDVISQLFSHWNKPSALFPQILQYSRLIGDISTTATHEASLEVMLVKVIELWKNTDFRLINHNSDSSVVKIIASADDIMAQLEESQITINSMKSSRYVEPIKVSLSYL